MPDWFKSYGNVKWLITNGGILSNHRVSTRRVCYQQSYPVKYYTGLGGNIIARAGKISSNSRVIRDIRHKRHTKLYTFPKAQPNSLTFLKYIINLIRLNIAWLVQKLWQYKMVDHNWGNLSDGGISTKRVCYQQSYPV